VYDTPLQMGLCFTTWRFRTIGASASSRSYWHERVTSFNVVAIDHTAGTSGMSNREADRATERGIWSHIRIIELYPCIDHRTLSTVTILGQIQ
jgi:hypothetical protein